MSTIGLGFSISTDDHIPTNLSSQKSRPRWTIVDTYVTAVKNSCRVSMNSGKEGLGQSMKLFIRDAEINKFSNRLRAAVKGDGGTYEPGGKFAPHEAIGVHEFWGVAWIRSECHFEGLPNDKKTQDMKLEFSERAFYSLEQRSKEQQGRCRCFLMVRREDSYRKHVPWNLIYGTMELNIRYFSPGQNLPQEHLPPPPLSQVDTRVSNSYMYISNLCVKRSVRRQGLATLMLQYAKRLAKKDGITKLFVRVQFENEAALKLYEKNGFKVAYETIFEIYADRPLLLYFDASTSD